MAFYKYVPSRPRPLDRSGDARPPRWGAQAGQVTPVLAVALLLATMVGVGVVRVAVAASHRAAAEAAADASALAGAEEGRRGAEEAAHANGAELVSFVQDHLDVEVQVVRRGHHAIARARWQPRLAT